MNDTTSRHSGLGTFYGVGVGPGDPSLLTLKAVEVFKSADVIFHVVGPNSDSSVSGRIVDSVEGCRAKRVELLFTMARDRATRMEAWKRHARQVAEELRAGRDCAMATIGDPMLYSTYIYVMREVMALLPEVRIVTVPGIAAYQAAASRANLPLVEDNESLVIVPALDSASARQAVAGADVAVLLKTYRQRAHLAEWLKETGATPVLYAARVGCEDETLCQGEDVLARMPEQYLSLLVVKRKGRS
jgi:precorrin-2/cobalt-factor-2 C20-methyltransferase